jgi:serine acetyltransferase
MSKNNEHLVLGKYLTLYMEAAILGKYEIGNNCKISNNYLFMDKDMDDNSIYIDTTANYLIKHNSHKDAICDDQPDE